MQNNEIKLTQKELEVLQDSSFLKVKQYAIEKVVNLFSELRNHIDQAWEYNTLWKERIPCQKDDVKISKGENYRQLPYVILDYPRLFSRSDVFAYRTMLWWGHFFSFTLHLQGKSLEEFRESLKATIPQLKAETDLFISVAESPWEYHYGQDNYKPLASIDKNALMGLLDDKSFIKLSSWIPVSADTEQVIGEGKAKFEQFMNLLFR